MTIIRTVLGDKNPKELGAILPHEHTITHMLGAEADHKSSYNREEAIRKASEELEKVRESYGISGLLDAAPVDLGRDTEFQVEVSRRSGVQIIASTGLYTDSMGIPTYWRMRDIDELEEFFTKEITEGVVGTDVKCGVIKVATGPEFFSPPPARTKNDGDRLISPNEERAFRAAARVQRKLGVAITTHTDPADWAALNIGAKQLDILESEGADPSHCIIGHASNTANLRDLIELLKRGCNLAFDGIGLNWAFSDDVIAAVVTSLVALGHENQLLLSHDRWSTEITRPPKEEGPPLFPSKDWGLMHREFIPRLIHGGVSEKSIHQMTVENPGRILAF